MKRILAIAAGIITLGGAAVVIDRYDPWVRKVEFYLLAGDVYLDKSRLRFDQILSIERTMEREVKDGNPSRVRELRIRKQELEKEQRRYEKYHEDYLKRQKGN